MNQQELDRLTTQMNQFMELENRKNLPTSKSDELRELGVKRCSTCTKVKNIEEFSRDSRKRDGLRGYCKVCKRARAASYREANPEYDREYYRDNRAKKREYGRNYYQENREQLLEYNHNRYNDPEDNRRLTTQLNRGYHRAIEAGNTAVRITPEDLVQYWESIGLDPWTCYLTGEKLDHLTRSIDHVRAIGNGGEHIVTNLAPCTFEANKKKNAATADEARESLSA